MPRKTLRWAFVVLRAVVASMRPRPDAAENVRRGAAAVRRRPGFNEAAARCRGKPGRRSAPSPAGCYRFNEAAARCRGKLPGRHRRWQHRPDASMRPRPDAAENRHRRSSWRRATTASMRPRPDAAENTARPAAAEYRPGSFNEAAARCRGKRNRGGSDARGLPPASMRPRPDAAENTTSTRESSGGGFGLQ